MWQEITILLSERLQNLDTVLTELEKYPIYTGLDEQDSACIFIMKHAQTSLGKSCRSLKSRAQYTLKLLSNLKS